jgi:DMSO/TMAO reductase YedYZ molybdopterin-dependent catalytic subunit
MQRVIAAAAPPAEQRDDDVGQRARGPWMLAALAGVLSAAAALGIAELVAALVRPQAAPVLAVGSAVIDATPTWLKDVAIRTLGTNDKPVLLTGVLVVLVVCAAVAGAASLSRRVIGFGFVALLGVSGIAAALARPGGSVADALPSLLGAVAGTAALAVLLNKLQPARIDSPTDVAQDRAGEPLADRLRGLVAGRDRKASYDRRGFLVGSAVTGIAAVVAGGAGRVLLARRFDATASRAEVTLPPVLDTAANLARTAEVDVPGVSRFFTDNRDFYRVDTALIVPAVAADAWNLRVHGRVEHPLELDYTELLNRPMVERDITLACVSNEVGGRYVGTARWLGTPLRDLLLEAGIDPQADQLVARSTDGMTIGTPTAAVLDGRDALLAIGMNGEPLPLEHGFPVRMIVPGLYGYVSACKWLVDLEATTFDAYDPYWTARGWGRDAPIKTMSRIDVPRPLAQLTSGQVAVAGVAWAQHRGIDRVEVRVDRGAWQDAGLASEHTPDTWRQWVWEWDAIPGTHTLEVRATDRTGTSQPEERARPFPDGATGWHSVVVQVSKPA